MSVNPVNFAPYIYEPWWTDPAVWTGYIFFVVVTVGIALILWPLIPSRQRQDPPLLTEEQKTCSHTWERMGESGYSHCKKCLLMRHDVDGDLINPLIFTR